MSYISDMLQESNKIDDQLIFDFDTKSKLKRNDISNIDEHEDLEEDIKIMTEGSSSMVSIEDYLGPENYTESIEHSAIKESVDELPDRPQKGRPGSPEHDANINRRRRVAKYRQLANIPDDFKITEDNINNWALTRTCTIENCPKEKLTAELLKQPYTGLEKYEED